jgi:hypothetical protein
VGVVVDEVLPEVQAELEDVILEAVLGLGLEVPAVGEVATKEAPAGPAREVSSVMTEAPPVASLSAPMEPAHEGSGLGGLVRAALGMTYVLAFSCLLPDLPGWVRRLAGRPVRRGVRPGGSHLATALQGRRRASALSSLLRRTRVA